MPDPAKPLRVLVSEGSSTSAREAITILGLSGHDIEVCDPSPWCLSRFSGLVRKFHRCPGLRDDPAGYLAFIEQRLADGKFDVLLPTHEQGFLFARAKQRIEGQGMRAPVCAQWALCREQRRTHAGGNGLDQRRAACGDGGITAGLAEIGDQTRAWRIWRASARSREYQGD
jgi:hypothetical protein